MQVEFWGTRGSVAAPGPFTVRYGGNTSCVADTLTDGTLLVLDAGTGIRRLGHALAARPPVTVHLFLSHCHWDHIQGFPFFAPAYCPNAHLSIYGYPAARQKIRKTMTDQMEGAYFPVDFSQLSAKIEFIDLWQDTLRLGTSRITLVETNHPGGGVGFRIQEGDRSLVYLTDNELGTAGNGRFTGFCHGATLLIHDAHYTPEEMETHRGRHLLLPGGICAGARRRGAAGGAVPPRSGAHRRRHRCHGGCLPGRDGAARDRFTCFAAAEGAVLSLRRAAWWRPTGGSSAAWPRRAALGTTAVRQCAPAGSILARHALAALNRQVPSPWRRCCSRPAGAGLLALLGWVLWRGRAGPSGLAALAALTAGIGWGLAFSALWGVNYRRPPLAQRLGIPVGGTPNDLARTARWLARETVRLAPSGRRRRPPPCPTRSRSWMPALRRPTPGGGVGRPARRRLGPAKPVLASGLLCRLGLSGIYSPFTGEPNYNRLQPATDLPFAIAHEKAHQRGIAPEDEANFAAFLALHTSPDRYLRYSAALHAAGYVLGALAHADPQAYARLLPLVAGRPVADWSRSQAFWQRHCGPAQRVSQRVNDLYLRANRVPGGIQSYGAVTDLLVGYHRARR